MSFINPQKVILDILKDNEPKFFFQLYAEYRKIVGDQAITEQPFRRHLNILLKQNLVKRGDEYVQRRGYLFTVAENTNPLTLGSASQVQYGMYVYEAEELLKELWNQNTHPLITKSLWDGYRLNLIKLLLSCSEGAALNQEEFRDKVKTYRDLINSHLMEVNSLLNSDVWSKPKQKAILSKVGNNQAQALIEYLQQYDSESLPNWE